MLTSRELKFAVPNLNINREKFYLFNFGANAKSAHLPAESPNRSVGSVAATILAASSAGFAGIAVRVEPSRCSTSVDFAVSANISLIKGSDVTLETNLSV
jgi:hypothetical protein